MNKVNEKKMDALMERMDNHPGIKMVFNLYRDSYTDMLLFCTFIKSFMKIADKHGIPKYTAAAINKICDEAIAKAEKCERTRYNMRMTLRIKSEIINEIGFSLL